MLACLDGAINWPSDTVSAGTSDMRRQRKYILGDCLVRILKCRLAKEHSHLVAGWLAGWLGWLDGLGGLDG